MRAATMRGAVAWVAAVGLLGMLTACGAGGESVDEDLTVERAKATTLELTDEVIALIPADGVASVERPETGIFLSCDAPDAHTWSIDTTVTLADGADADAFVTEIADAFAAREGFSTRDASDGEDAGVQILPDAGGSVVAAVWHDGAEIHLGSYSPCVRLPEGLTPHDRY